MIGNKRLTTVLSVTLALLILGASNHCIFEEAFVSVGKFFSGHEDQHHLLNHLGSQSQHHHEEAPEPHEHGQPHSLVVLNADRSGGGLVKILGVFLPLVGIISFFISFRMSERSGTLRLPCKVSDPPGILSSFISSLTFAPQAPPTRC